MSIGHKRSTRQGLTIAALTGTLALAGVHIARAQDGADAGHSPQASQQSADADQGNADQAPGAQAGARERGLRGRGGRDGGFGPGAAPGWRGARDFRDFREFQEWQQWQAFEHWQHRTHRGFGPGRDMARGPMGGMLLDRPLLGAFRRLDLTQDQWQKVRSILTTAGQQARPATGAQRPDPAQMLALINPGDPGHAQALQAAQDRATARFQRASQLQQNLYDVLTPQQKTHLTEMLAQVRQRAQQRLRQRGPSAQNPDQGPEGNG